VSEGAEHPSLVRCANCGHEVPDGAYCGHCGASLVAGVAKGRRHAYAAAPAESVYHVGLATTLFPHLARRGSAMFAWCALTGVLVVFVLVALNLFASAAAVAVLLLPVLYLLYLYEARVYGDRPWSVLALVFVLPLALGVLMDVFLGGVITSLALLGDRSLLLVLEILLWPLLALAATIVGPALLLGRSAFEEVLDAVALGASSGLAFNLGVSAVAVWPLLAGPVVSEGVPAQWMLLLLRQGVLMAFVNMAAASLLSAAIWRRRHGSSKRLDERWFWSAPAMVAVAVAARITVAALGITPRLLLNVLGTIVAIFLLFLYLRLAVHNALLEEGRELEIGPTSTCPECHRLVPTMRFCPACGVNRSAAPRQHRPGGATPARPGETG
jgi:hypothetical protein